MTHKKKIGTVAYYVVGILIAILAIIPFLWMVSTSLKARGALMSIPIEWIPKEPTIASYVKVFSKFPFFSTIGNSLFISVTYTFITLISASMAAFAFAKLKFPKADLLLKVFLATMMIPTQVTIIPLFVVMNKMSLINSYASVILPSIFRPFAVFLLVQQMRTIPNDYLDAASIDGATKWQQTKHITMPCIKPVLIMMLILDAGKIFYSDFGLFYQVPMNSGALINATNTIDTYVYRGLIELGDISMSSAACVYQSLMGFALVMIANWLTKRYSSENALF